MIRRIRSILLIVALAVVAAACSSGTIAATVNEAEFTDEDVLALRTTERGVTIAAEQFRGDLTTLIVGQAQLDAAEEDYGIAGLDTDEARQAYLESATPQEVAVVTNLATNPELTQAAVDEVTTQLAVRAAVSEALAQDEEILTRVWEDQQQFLILVCARHILVATAADAEAAKARIDAGEDFSAVATEVSLDTGSPGGQLPCPSNPIDYVEPFSIVVASAPVGEVTEPFETEFGWHIVVVDSREFPQTYDEFAGDPGKWVPEAVIAGAFANWRDDALGRADIRVRSQIGRWFAEGDGILPPPESP